MVEIIALQEYTDQYISLYEGQIRNINQDLANKLIEQGIVALHKDITPSGANYVVYYAAAYQGETSDPQALPPEQLVLYKDEHLSQLLEFSQAKQAWETKDFIIVKAYIQEEIYTYFIVGGHQDTPPQADRSVFMYTDNPLADGGQIFVTYYETSGK